MNSHNCLLPVMILSLVSVFGCSDEQPEDAGPEVSEAIRVEGVAPVGRLPIVSELETVGSLVPWRFATIVSEVDGVIDNIPMFEKKLETDFQGVRFSKELFLDIGHPVKEGTLLAEIASKDFELAVQAAEAKLALSQAQLADLIAWKRPEERAQLAARLSETSASLERCRKDMERSEQLLDQGALPQGDYDASQLAFDSALAAKQQAEQAVKIAEAPTETQIAVARAQEQLAQAEVDLQKERLAKCKIYCPFDAVIADRYVGKGDRVTAMPRVEIMQIIDPSFLLVQVSVPEKYQGRIEINDLAEVRVEGAAMQVPGLVALVNRKIDPETRTFRVRVGIRNETGVFKSGSFAKVILKIPSASGSLTVPARAVSFDEGSPTVFVYHEGRNTSGRVQRRSVSLGISNQAECEVFPEAEEGAGVRVGEQVVLGDTSRLSDGLEVCLEPADAVTVSGDPASSLQGVSSNNDGDRSVPLAAAQPEVK